MPLPFNAVGRRHVLAAMAGTGVASRVGSASARDRSNEPVGVKPLEPVGSLDLRGVAEAVVDDDGETVYCSVVDGFAVVDVSDASNPTVLAEERELTYNGSDPMTSIMDVKMSGDRLLVSGPNGFGEGLSGFLLYDVSNPASPECVAVHETRFGPHNSFVDGDVVYLTGSGRRSPTVIYDVADDDPEEVARWSAADADDAWADVGRNFRSTHDVYVQDDTLYVAYWDAGTWMVDVSDPTSPTATAHLGGHDPAYLKSIESSQGISPEFRELPGNSHYVQPNADASAVFVGKEAWDARETDRDGGPGGIECWDLSGSDPELRSVLQPPDPDPDAGEDPDAQWTSHNFGIDGERLYTSWYGGGVRVYDVSDLAEPALLGAWRNPAATAFWTTKPLASGFVAASYVDPRNTREERRQGEGACLFAFPDPDAANADPAPTMTRRDFPAPDDQSTTTTPPGTTPNDDTTDDGTRDGTTVVDDPDQPTDGTTVVDDPDPTPGFGALTAITGGGLALWRLLDRNNDDD
jgi:hypothetical protein